MTAQAHMGRPRPFRQHERSPAGGGPAGLGNSLKALSIFASRRVSLMVRSCAVIISFVAELGRSQVRQDGHWR